MGWTDPDARREYLRRWREANPGYAREYYQANRDRINAATRQRRQANPEKFREQERANYQRNREQRRAAGKERYLADPKRDNEQSRRWRRENPERVRERNRQWRAAGGRNPKERRRAAAVAELWHGQGGVCYLCGDPLRLEDAHLEHDHRCCPHNEFCSFCIRGVSCARCNHVAGHAGDDPDRLELIARNLRAKLAEMDVRMAGKPQQLSLGDAG